MVRSARLGWRGADALLLWGDQAGGRQVSYELSRAAPIPLSEISKHSSPQLRWLGADVNGGVGFKSNLRELQAAGADSGGVAVGGQDCWSCLAGQVYDLSGPRLYLHPAFLVARPTT
eukprot:1119808-Rhodomonas_salina.3